MIVIIFTPSTIGYILACGKERCMKARLSKKKHFFFFNFISAQILLKTQLRNKHLKKNNWLVSSIQNYPSHVQIWRTRKKLCNMDIFKYTNIQSLFCWICFSVDVMEILQKLRNTKSLKHHNALQNKGNKTTYKPQMLQQTRNTHNHNIGTLEFKRKWVF